MEIIKQTIEHPATQHRLEIITESIDNVIDFTEIFVAADTVVGAQFYYTNPLMYVIVSSDMERHPQLYGNIHLLRVEDWEFIAHEPIFAVNQNFIEAIGGITDHYVLDPQTLTEQHEEYGLYLIGIKAVSR